MNERTKKEFSDMIGGYFESRYREGNKMSVLIVPDGSLIVYRNRKRVFLLR